MTTTTDYVGNMIYENGVLKRILTPAGYWQNGTYYYFLKDHLGSNRVVINGSGDVVESSSYYPSGMRFGESSVILTNNVQPYRHTGHEMQEMHGLNWIDNNARFRTVSDGSGFTGVDPHAEKYYSISPYTYCEGNPIRFIDSDGRDPGDIFRSKRLAAADFGHLYNDNSIQLNKEFGTTIYRITNTEGKFIGYSYSVPNIGNEHSLDLISPAPKEYETVAEAHTHGGYSGPKIEDNEFSGRTVTIPLTSSRSGDIGNYNINKIDGFVITSNGSIKEFNHSTGKITDLTNNAPEFKNIPSDQLDPTHVNTENALSPLLNKGEQTQSSFQVWLDNIFK